MFCYVGKASKIFIFIIAVIVVTGLVVGFGIFGRNIHPKSRKCSGEDCSLSDYSPPAPPPPPLQIPFPSLPDHNASNPSDPIVNSNAPPPPQPPPSVTTLPPPPSASLTIPSPPPPFPPPPPVSVVTPPAAVMAAPPQAVPVSPGPMNSG